METNEKQIVRVLNNILERIDTLEIQQARNKEFSAIVKKRLLDYKNLESKVSDKKILFLTALISIKNIVSGIAAKYIYMCVCVCVCVFLADSHVL